MTSRGTKAGEIRGSFESALAHGDLQLASAYARDLDTVGLDDAARLLHLMARDLAPAYNKAVVRWMRRYVEEVRSVTPEQMAEVADALAEMPADPSSAEVLLAALNITTAG